MMIRVFSELIIVSDDGLIVNYDKQSILEPPQRKEESYKDFAEKIADAIWKGTQDLKWKNELRLLKKDSFVFQIGLYQFIVKQAPELNCVSLYDQAENDRMYFSLDSYEQLKTRLTEYIKGCNSKDILFDDDSFIEFMKDAAAYDNLVEQRQDWFDGLDNQEEYMGALKAIVCFDDLFPTADELKALTALGYTFVDYQTLLKEMPAAVTVNILGDYHTLWKHIEGYDVKYKAPNGFSAQATPETKRKISGIIHLLLWMRTVKQNHESKESNTK